MPIRRDKSIVVVEDRGNRLYLSGYTYGIEKKMVFLYM